MISKPHRQNSDFQLKYFLAGSCFTPDGAWMLMYNQKLDMEAKLNMVKSDRMKQEAKVLRLKHFIETSTTEWDKLEAEADLLEHVSTRESWELNVQAAKNELKTILDIMRELEPQRKYGHLSILEASEAAQRDEWREELKYRAENFLITQGTIPFDHFAIMRQHPDFESEIYPHILKVSSSAKEFGIASEKMYLLE